MGLSDYKQKRSFDKTPEPEGKVSHAKGELKFVVQKHQASHLHYDFRLEMEGVLKSWAVPKGPSLNPADKRLAMMVEDHPYEYRTFEGIIPKGNYGAGTVIIWDEGTFEAADEKFTSVKALEKHLLAQLRKGNLKILLKGKKLKGEFALVKTNRTDQENSWLLMKKDDKHATLTDIISKDKSVVSNLTLEQVAKTSTNEWQSNRTSSGKLKDDVPVPAPEKKSKAEKKVAGVKTSFPGEMKPMLATLVDEAFDDDDWIYEVKWDGYRAMAFKHKRDIDVFSRNLISYNEKFHPIVAELSKIDGDVILDGEIIAMNEEGNSDFQLLQAWQKTGRGDLAFYVFDIIWLNGRSLIDLPLLERKEILRSLLPEEGMIKYSDHVVGRGREFYGVAVEAKLEGVIAKKADSTYSPNVRSRNWLKIKTHQRQEVIIAGFTKGRGGRQYFGALVLAIYQGDELKYIGHSGSGFDEKTLKDVYSRLQPLITEEMPFSRKPKTNMPVVWVKPQLICEVKFQEWTRDNMMRHPIFLGLRADKDPKDVRREVAVHTEEIADQTDEDLTTATKKSPKKKAAGKKTSTKVTSRKKKAGDSPDLPNISPFDPTEKKRTENINGNTIAFTNLDKLYWKKEKIYKADLLNYYAKISPYIMPYLKDRPQSLNRHPDGFEGKSFYQKNVTGKVPDWVQKYDYVSDTDGKKSQYYVCTGIDSLLYMANLGCIEINPWHSRVQAADNPDWCVIDLDPGEISFEKVIEAANIVKQVLDSIDVPSWCKTSGSTGVHIYIPLGAKYSYDQSRQLAELIVTLVHDQIPGFTSLERSPAKRKTKIYLDYLQNRAIQTIAAPYSLRPKPGATVSTPLHWEEVKKGLKISNFTINNIMDRLRNEGDIFGGVLGPGINLDETLERVAQLF